MWFRVQLLTLSEDLNITTFKYYPIMFSGIVKCLNIYHWLSFFFSTIELNIYYLLIININKVIIGDKYIYLILLDTHK